MQQASLDSIPVPSSARLDIPLSDEATPLPAVLSAHIAKIKTESVYEKIIPSSIGWEPGSMQKLPILEHLENGCKNQRPSGWHRNDERAARCLKLIKESDELDLELWELELVWTETLLLSGCTVASSYIYLAVAWGQCPGFHKNIANFICQRRANTLKEPTANQLNEHHNRDQTVESLEISYYAFVADSISNVNSPLQHDSDPQINQTAQFANHFTTQSGQRKPFM